MSRDLPIQSKSRIIRSLMGKIPVELSRFFIDSVGMSQKERSEASLQFNLAKKSEAKLRSNLI